MTEQISYDGQIWAQINAKKLDKANSFDWGQASGVGGKTYERFTCVLDGCELSFLSVYDPKSAGLATSYWAPLGLGLSMAIDITPDCTRPQQKPGEFLKDYDSRVAKFRAEMAKSYVPATTKKVEQEGQAIGLRFTMVEFKDDYREVVLSVPQEAELAKVSQLESYVRNLVDTSITVRSVVFPYK